MKHIKISIAALIASCLLMTGCANGIVFDNTPLITSTIIDNSIQADPETSNQQINSDNNEPTETEKIFKLLKDYGGSLL